MGLFLVTAPAVEPVSIAEAKTQCRADTPDEDSLINSLVVAAREYVENATRRALIRRTWDDKRESFPCYGESIWLPTPPVSSVTSVSYVDQNGDTQTWSSSLYRTSLPNGEQAGLGRIEPIYGVSWPSTRCVSDAVTIRVVCGYGTTASTVPEGLRAAIKLLVAHWYAMRQPVNVGNLVTTIPLTVDALIWPFKVF